MPTPLCPEAVAYIRGLLNYGPDECPSRWVARLFEDADYALSGQLHGEINENVFVMQMGFPTAAKALI